MTDKNETLMKNLRYRLSKASGGQAIVDEDDLEAVIDIVDKAGSLIETLASELRDLNAAQPYPVKVKKLEWQWRDDVNGGRFETDGALGRYKVWGAESAGWKWSTHLGRSDMTNYRRAEEAKAGAQSDFEAIVLAALDLRSGPGETAA